MNFSKRFFGRGCSHRFTWPRIDADGHYYQICPDCGTAYEYDWTLMESACAESSITSRVTGVAVARVSGVRYLIIRAATRPALRERALRALAGDRMPAVVANLARVLGRANFRVTLV